MPAKLASHHSSGIVHAASTRSRNKDPRAVSHVQLNVHANSHHTTIIIGDVGNTEFDTLWLSRPYAQLTRFGGSDFGMSF